MKALIFRKCLQRFFKNTYYTFLQSLQYSSFNFMYQIFQRRTKFSILQKLKILRFFFFFLVFVLMQTFLFLILSKKCSNHYQCSDLFIKHFLSSITVVLCRQKKSVYRKIVQLYECMHSRALFVPVFVLFSLKTLIFSAFFRCAMIYRNTRSRRN